MNRLLSFLLVCVASVATAAPKPAAPAPKLVVVIVVDQMRRSEVDRLLPHFTGGFRRLLDEGARLLGASGMHVRQPQV